MIFRKVLVNKLLGVFYAQRDQSVLAYGNDLLYNVRFTIAQFWLITAAETI